MKQIILIVLILVWSQSLYSAEETVALLNFKINSSQNIDYLSTAIPDMILPLLVNSRNIKVVERSRMKDALEQLKLEMSGIVDDREALGIGKFVGARYIILGSLTMIKTNISIDARIIEVETGTVVTALKQRTKGEESIMDSIDILGTKLVNYLEGNESKISSSVKITGPLSVELNTGETEINNGSFKIYVDGKYYADSHKYNRQQQNKTFMNSYSYDGDIPIGVHTIKIEWEKMVKSTFGYKPRKYSKEWKNITVKYQNLQRLEHTL